MINKIVNPNILEFVVELFQRVVFNISIVSNLYIYHEVILL